MIIATDELLEALRNIGRSPKDIKCAVIGYNSDCMIELVIEDIVNDRDCVRRAILPIGWGNDKWLEFLQELNFNYHNGYGSQELFGIVWFNDDSWLERYEYDGAESWHYKICPKIPKSLFNK